MPKDSLYKPVDHFLQSEILTRLMTSDKPIRFSNLKDDGIENSLFMYHANKLINRGLIQKQEDGFSLTVKGARWVNYVDSSLDLAPLTPRPLVQFIIEDATQNILVAKRRGSLKDHLNDYLLPGNIYRHGLPLADNVARILTELFSEDHILKAEPVTVADVIHTASDGFVTHVLSYIFCVKTNSEKTTPLEHPLFTTEWVSVGSITRDIPSFKRSEFIPLLFERLPFINPHENFLMNCK
ncbi:MAG TPA: hypothetical protein VFZ58_00905 [Candidatus Saccharimonadales bacterium]